MEEKKCEIVAKVSAVQEYELTDEDIEDIMVTALDGGIGYWACLDNTTSEFADQGDEYVETHAAKILMRGGTLCFIDDEEWRDGNEVRYELTMDKLLLGIRKYIEEYNRYDAFGAHGEIDLCELDAMEADLIIQLAVFGEVVYG